MQTTKNIDLNITFVLHTVENHRFECTGVSFVKGANARNNNLKEYTNNEYMTNTPKDEQAQGRTNFGMNTVRWQRLFESLRQLNAIAAADIFNKKESIPKIDALIQFIWILRY